MALLISATIALVVSIIGAIAFPATGIVVSANEPQAVLWVPLWSISFIATVLLVLGLPGLYLYQAGRTRFTGFLGFLLTLLSSLLTLTITFFYIVVLPLLAEKSPGTLKDTLTPTMAVFALGGGMLLCVGFILLGIATIRAKVFPSMAGIFLCIGGLLSPATIGVTPLVTLIGVLSTCLVSLGLGWIGYIIAQPERLAVPTGLVTMETKP
jgi:hypothetical protein